MLQVLSNMSTDQMVIILPSALVAMYVIITLQNNLSERPNPLLGLIIPLLCLVVSTILAVRPLFITNTAVDSGLALFCLRMWLTFNIPTIVFMFPYIRARRIRKAYEAQLAANAQSADMAEVESQS